MTRSRRLVCVVLTAVFGVLLPAVGLAAPKEDEKTPGELLRIAEDKGLKESFEAFGKLAGIRDRESLRQWKVIAGLNKLARHPNPRKARRALETLYKLYRFDKSIKYKVLTSVADILQDKDGHAIVRIKSAEVLGSICVAKELQDQNAPARLGQIGRGNQAVVAAAHDDRVVGFGHQSFFLSGSKKGFFVTTALAR